MPRKLTEAERKAKALRPRKRGDGSIYWDTSRQRFRAAVVVSRPGAKIERKTVSGMTASEVEEKVEKLKSNLVKGKRVSKSLTVETWIEQWMKNESHKPSTRRSYKSLLKQYVSPAIGKRRLDELEVDDVRALHAFMKKKGLSTTTTGHAHRLCSAAMNSALSEQRLQLNPFSIIKAPKNAVSGRRSFTEKENDAFIEAVSGREEEARWLAAVLLGMRQSEVLGMTWSALDLESKIPTIEIRWQLQTVQYLCNCETPCRKSTVGRLCPTRSLDVDSSLQYVALVGAFCLIAPKSDSSKRLIPIPVQMLGPLRRRHVQYLAEKQEVGYSDYDLVWARETGWPINHGDDGKVWKSLLEEAGIEHLPLHTARHTAASALLRAGVDPSLQQRILGHSSYVTSQRYQHTDSTMLQKAIEATYGKTP